MDVLDACSWQHTCELESGIGGMGDEAENFGCSIRQPCEDKSQAGNMGEDGEYEQKRTKIENECGCRNSNKRGKQGITRYSSEIIDYDRKSTYLGCQGYTEQAVYTADELVVRFQQAEE